MSDLTELISNLNSAYKDLTEKKQALNETLKQIASAFENLGVETSVSSSTKEKTSQDASTTSMAIQTDIVKFNVGGTLFSTLKTTITKKIKKKFNQGEFYENNLLEDLLTKKSRSTYDYENNAIFIDRNPKYFNFILDYLRKIENLNDCDQFESAIDKKTLEELIKEANFYKVYGLKDLIEYSNILFSKILTSNQTNDLIKLCKFQKFNLNLIYRGSADGFSGEIFHKKCDKIPKTLTVVKVKDNDNIFGGYTEQTWDGDKLTKKDPKSFVFSLVNKDDNPIRMDYDKNRSEYAIFCYSSYGPVFGGGHDFYIANDSNLDKISSSNLSNSFFHPVYSYGSDEAKNFLAGSCLFTVEEIEVYQKI
jgi:hypothetical protein